MSCDPPALRLASSGLTDTVWLCIDIKSVGPRDDADHTVMSHNQISGSGDWGEVAAGVFNRPMIACGARSAHDFHPALPPILILPDNSVAPVITMAVKPVYTMTPADAGQSGWMGQPLQRVDCITIPNGLLLVESPGYLHNFPGLLFPGKDAKEKDPRKLRARISFAKLRQIAQWRHTTVWNAT